MKKNARAGSAMLLIVMAFALISIMMHGLMRHMVMFHTFALQRYQQQKRERCMYSLFHYGVAQAIFLDTHGTVADGQSITVAACPAIVSPGEKGEIVIQRTEDTYSITAHLQTKTHQKQTMNGTVQREKGGSYTVTMQT